MVIFCRLGRSHRLSTYATLVESRLKTQWRPNRVTERYLTPSPTLPTLQVRSGRFNKSARSTKLSDGVALCFDPQVFHADHPALLNARSGHQAVVGLPDVAQAAMYASGIVILNRLTTTARTKATRNDGVSSVHGRRGTGAEN